ncbi:MAG: amidohydrolase [Gemmatimonadota bacterium]
MKRTVALLVLALTGCGPGTADLVLRGGHVVTVDSTLPEAEAVAVRGDRILAVGTDEEIAPYIEDDTRVIELEGRLLVPGFIEGHGHYMGVGNAQLNLDLTRARTWDDIVAMVDSAAAEAAPGEWILGRGWHQEKWDGVPEGAVEGVPTHRALSAAAPENPVLLTHASGHAAIANARALELAGIDRDYTPPEGGEVVRDASGEPTGLLRENAQDPVGDALARSRAEQTPEERGAHFDRVVQLAGQDLLSKGITSFHDAGASFSTIDGFRRLAEAGRLPVRLYVMVREPNEALEENLADYRMVGVGNNFLTVRSIKKQIDGALGAHGAWLLEPYTDMPSRTGLVLEPVDEIERTAQLALEHDFQLSIHAIGDRANREVLDIYQAAFEGTSNGSASADQDGDRRWRIEHAQHLHPDDIDRFAELGVIAAMQTIHGTSDAPWVPKRLGEKRAAEGAYRWQDLWRSGAVVANGTDAPVEDANPIPSYWAAVSRMLPDGTRFDPDQRLTREQALRSYTINNAYAAFEEDIKGSITPGKLADLVVLDRDILTAPEDEVRGAGVLYTILGGEVVFERGASGG